jgi:hypothetical protein
MLDVAQFNSEDDHGLRRFTSVVCPQGLFAIAEITPEGFVTGRTFDLPEELDGLTRRVSERRGRANQYFTLNEPVPRSEQTGKNGRVAERDIRKIRGIDIDIDPAKDATFASERERLLEMAAQMKAGQHGAPTAVVDSGGGIQAIYLFETPIDATPDNVAAVKRVAKALAQKLGGDATHSLDHLFRLPFTENLPDERKRKRGRKPAKARLIWCSVKDRRHTLLSLCDFAPPSPEPTPSPAAKVVIDGREIEFVLGAPENLEDELAARLERAKAERPALAKLIESECEDRSGRDFAIACACTEAGITDPTDLACIVGAHSEKAAEKGEAAAAYLQSTVERALAKTKPCRAEDFFTPVGESAPKGDEASSGKRTFKVYTAGESARLAMTRRAKPLVERLLDCGALSVIYGVPGVGKSFVMLDMAYRVAAGKPHGDRKVTQGPVVYVAAEGGGGIHARVKALVDTHGEHDAEGFPIPFYILPERVNLRDHRADLTPFLDMLRDAERQAGKLVLVVIDTLARSMGGGDENSPVDMGAMVEHFDRIRHATGAHVAVVHHTGKDATRGMRGHSSLLGAIDTELEVVEGEVRSEKQRDMESGESFGYRLESVYVGVDDEGIPVKTAIARIVAPEERQGAIDPAQLQPLQRKIVDILRSAGAGAALKVEEMADALIAPNGKPYGHGSIRKRLSELRDAGLVEKIGKDRWALRADILSETDEVDESP